MISPDDPRLTALADGALRPEEAELLERELAKNPAASAEVERLRALQAELRGAFAAEDAELARARVERVVRVAPRLPSWLHQLAAAVCVVLVSGAVLLPTVGKVRETSRRSVDSSNLRQIGQASLIFASDHKDVLPGAMATDVWDYARLVARDGGLNDATIWAISADPAVEEQVGRLSTVLTQDRGALEPQFQKLKPSWAVALGEITANSPSTTPIAWTRGLKTDGTWAPHSPNGTEGGHVVFLGGNVVFYRDAQDAFQRFDGKGTTSNILEALPPGARIAQYEPTHEERVAWAEAARAYRAQFVSLGWSDVFNFVGFFLGMLIVFLGVSVLILRIVDRLRGKSDVQSR
jgi:hypothetical protein